MKGLTQEEMVLIWLKEKAINPMQALAELGCFRLAAVIHRLRKKGFKIITKRISKQGRYRKINFGEYSLKSNK